MGIVGIVGVLGGMGERGYPRNPRIFLDIPLKQKAPSAPERGRSFLSFYEQAGLSESHLRSLATLETDEEALFGVSHALTLEVVVNSFTGSGICLNSLYT